ncbi:MAG: T9SS type A sorting domain-containing protein [bacterium]
MKKKIEMVKLIKYFLVIIFASQATFQLFSQQKLEVIAIYNCRNSDVSLTTVRDMNSDGVYDTYTIQWCNGSTNSYPILAIGDIRRWPPSGIPTREILSASQIDGSFTEAYFTMNTNLIYNWFTKYSNCDTVFYYDNNQDLKIMTDVNEYTSDNIEFMVAPNPANEYAEIDYSLKQNGWVTITIYNEIGIVVDVLEDLYKNEGTYNLHYNLRDISTGKYFLTVKLGLDEIFTKQIVVEK